MLAKKVNHSSRATSVYYQVYLPAFADGNGDGIGDLPGVISKLDYLEELGIDGIILSPFYQSAGRDSFYAITDHCQIDKRFGDLRDFTRLGRELKTRQLKLIVDFIPNHTSSDHPWFKAARSDEKNQYRHIISGDLVNQMVSHQLTGYQPLVAQPGPLTQLARNTIYIPSFLINQI